MEDMAKSLALLRISLHWEEHKGVKEKISHGEKSLTLNKVRKIYEMVQNFE